MVAGSLRLPQDMFTQIPNFAVFIKAFRRTNQKYISVLCLVMLT